MANPIGAVLNEPGTGKTRSLVCAAEYKKLAGHCSRALFICPAAVRHTIGREIQKWTNLSVTVLDGPSVKRVKQLEETDTYFYVTNYRSCVNIEKQLIKKGFDLIILDESTRVKSPESQRHKAIYRIAKECSVRWISTGTPLPNGPMDLYGQYSILDKRILGSKSVFKRRYLQYAPGEFPPRVVGYQNEEELRAVMARHSIRFLKRDCLDLPDKVFVDVEFQMAPEQRRVYNEFTRMMMAELPSGDVMPIKSAMSKFMRFHQTVSGFVGTGEDCEWLVDKNPKYDALVDLLDTLHVHEHKVIIWCSWVPSIEMLADKLAEYNPALFYGEVPDQDAEIQKFNLDPSCRIMIGNSRVGIGCTMNVAPYAIYYELPYFDVEAFDQSQDRNHRIGQEAEKVTYYLLKSPGTVDATIWRNLQGKYKFSDYVTGDDLLKVAKGEV
jgi:SNF2 family DNA or RNA helicase